MCHQLKAGEHKLLGGYGLFYSWTLMLILRRKRSADK